MSSLPIVDKGLWGVVVLTVLPVKLYYSAHEVCHPSEVRYLHFMTKKRVFTVNFGKMYTLLLKTAVPFI